MRKLTRLLPLLFLVSSAEALQNTSADIFNGRWEAENLPGSPWLFDITVKGNKPTGRAFQNGGQPGPVEIYEGKINGNEIEFNCKSPDGAKVITFRGRLEGRDLIFARSIEILLDRTSPAFPVNPLAETGAFGATGPTRFTARRTGPIPTPAIDLAAAASKPVDLGGRWESVQWNLDLWIFSLKSEGAKVTGTITQRAGPGRQQQVGGEVVPFQDGRLENNTVTFKVTPPTGPGARNAAATATRTLYFSGKVYGDEIAFTRTIEIPVGAALGGDAIYGVYAPQTFLAKRASTVPLSDTETQKEIERAAAKWTAGNFTQYEFTIRWKCMCWLPPLPLVFDATKTTGTVRLESLPGVSGKKPDVERYGRFEQIFELLRVAADHQPYKMKVEFDPQLGYPVSGQIDFGGTSADDDIEFTVSNFRGVK